MHNLHFRSWNSAQPNARNVFNALFANPDQSAVNGTDASWTPRVDIREEPTRFVILADVPGVDPASIEVNMDKGVLSIKGVRAIESSVDGEKVTRAERVRGAFQRNFSLPESANAEGITASGKFGVLEISIPKLPESAPRRISISH